MHATRFILFLTLILALNQAGRAQDIPILDEAYLSSKIYSFELKDQEISGEGAQFLKQKITNSQYFMIGEFHGSPQLSNFTAALIPFFQATKYNAFACEVGPHSAQLLQQLMNKPNKAVEQLKAFNQKYYLKEVEGEPIPFFDAVEDAQFLGLISQASMPIWGLDQEYYYSFFHLNDQLLKLVKGNPSFAKLEQQKKEVDALVLEWLIKEDEDEEGFPVFSKILAEPLVQAYFAHFESIPEGKAILTDLKISWDIYDRYQSGSHSDRVAYIRQNFKEAHDEMLKSGQQPKVLIKIGGAHASKQNYYGTFDVGALVNDMAVENGFQFTNLNFDQRYIQKNGELIDLLEKYPSRNARIEIFLRFARPEQGTIFDFKAIRQDLMTNKVKLPENGYSLYWKKLIYGYDAYVILPTDYSNTPNY